MTERFLSQELVIPLAAADTVGGSVQQLWHWIVFAVVVAILLTLDLTVFHRRAQEPTVRQSAVWTLIWCALALSFNALIWVWMGAKPATEFLTGYVIEWSLSMDNVFVFAVVFNFFRVPLKYQYRVLFWGILGAIVMRLTFVLVGTAILKYADWVMWLFGLLLIYSGIKLCFEDESDVDPANNRLLRLARRFLPVSEGDHGDRFLVVENGGRRVTPLFLVLLVVESTDVFFAVDSVPAIFAITKDPFIVFTSNIFAILGLRALYFLLAGVMDVFRYLNYGLAAVLVFVGIKMVADYWVPRWFEMEEGEHVIGPGLSLAVVVTLLTIAIAASLLAKQREKRQLPSESGKAPAPMDRR